MEWRMNRFKKHSILVHLQLVEVIPWELENFRDARLKKEIVDTFEGVKITSDQLAAPFQRAYEQIRALIEKGLTNEEIDLLRLDIIIQELKEEFVNV
jgi:hypothetical protein